MSENRKEYKFTYIIDRNSDYSPFLGLHIQAIYNGEKHNRAIRCSGIDYDDKHGFIFLMEKFINQLKSNESLDSLIRVENKNKGE